MLHLLVLPELLRQQIERIAPGDDVVLQQGAVWSAWLGHANNAQLSALLHQDSQVYVLSEFLLVNGIEHSQVMSGVNIINYSGLVDLTIKNPVIHTWC